MWQISKNSLSLTNRLLTKPNLISHVSNISSVLSNEKHRQVVIIMVKKWPIRTRHFVLFDVIELVKY